MHDTGMFLFSSSFHVLRNTRPITETLMPFNPVNPPQTYRNIALDYAALGDDAAAEEALQQAENAELAPTSEAELAPEPDDKEIEKLEEQLAEQAESGDEAGQEETIKAIEERDPDYVEHSTRRVYSSSPSRDASPKSAPQERAQRRAETLNTMGLNYLRQGNSYKAGQAFMKAKEIQEKLGDDIGEAATLNNLGLMHYQTGNDKRSAEMFAASLNRMRRANDPVGTANVLNHLALLHLRWGRVERVQAKWREAESQYGEALKLFEEAAQIAATLDERGFAMTISNGIGMTQMELLLLYRRLGDKARISDPLRAQAYYFSANEAYQRGMRELQRSLTIGKELRRPGARGATLHNIGLMYAAAQLEREAQPHLWNALRLELATRNRLDAARTLSELGFLHEREGRALLQSGRNDAKNWRDRAVRLAWGILRNEQALYLYKRSLAIQEQLRETAKLEAFKIGIAEEATDAYQQTALLLMDSNRPAEAFDMTERARGRTFLDALGNARQTVRQAVTPEFAQQETALRQEADALRRKLDAALENASPDAEEMQHQLDAIEQRYERLLQEIELTRPEYASFYGVTPLTLPEAQALIPAEVTLLSYFVTPKTTLAFALTRSEFKAFSLPISEEEFWQMAYDMKEDPEKKPDAAPNALRTLYAQCVAPVETALKTETIGIIPHGALHYLPFAALDAAASDVDAPRYFGDQHHVFTLSGGISALPFIAAKPREHGTQAAIFGVTGNPPLPHVVEEAETIAQLYDTTPTLNESATVAEFLKQAHAASIIHVAAHARLDADNPALSSIQFGDRELRLHELYGMHLPQAPLVALSGCETRVGRLSRGDDLIALERTALVAGAPVVAASLWRVDDAATTALMTAFHQELTQGATPISALQQAQQTVRQQYPHPYYWAAFALSGWPL
ncbi:tetratricopeptide repeat protein [Candidatus Moduliflexus flocculans]|uniref:Tetratricopeptide repeat protein n=1 Tax=Candidatus Moduliflexus flocculans TaxID=1499966 RepID=A0A0S6VPC0_9BACT|nr:tetratricopeptide repeat protein [Candidatus Moduliflexus flocculans]